jgi:4-hydroxythreonine-4-phosphate dehydrogenase
MPVTLAITLGDVTGVGPEVALKALAAELAVDDCRYLLIGDAGVVERWNRTLNLELPLCPVSGAGPADRVCVVSTGDALPEALTAGHALAARAAVQWLRQAAGLCLQGRAQGVVTAPVNKHAIVQAGIPFVGQTELFTELAGSPKTAMMLLGHDDRERWLRVALATTHLPLRAVPDSLTPERVTQAIELAAQSCRDLALPRARLAVCGLNPHAGEGGEFGSEDADVIAPCVESARRRGIDAVGPLPADTVFHYALRGDYDAVVAMYHDQGLGPLKMIGFENGINWTLGLPFIRTSPDHGTAYDIAGQGRANPSSMRSALRLAKQLAAANR